MAMRKWIPTTNLLQLRRLGKLSEELGEAGSVAARCIIQGLDEVDPSSGKVNRKRLQDELADVRAQIDCTVQAFRLDQPYMARRTAEKMRQMAEWEAMFGPADHRGGPAGTSDLVGLADWLRAQARHSCAGETNAHRWTAWAAAVDAAHGVLVDAPAPGELEALSREVDAMPGAIRPSAPWPRTNGVPGLDQPQQENDRG